jgi:hypothetical protein
VSRSLGPSAILAIALQAACSQDVATSETCGGRVGAICTWAGTGRPAFNGDGLDLTESSLYWPIDLTIDTSAGTYILDWNNHRVRKVTRDNTLETVVGTDFVGDGPPDLSDSTSPGAQGTEVLLNHPTQFVPMPDGTLTLVSWHNHKLRSYDPATGRVTVTCGGAPGFGGDGGPARTAKLNQPSQLTVADDGTQYVVDQRNQVIRKIDPAGVISTFAGTPQKSGFDGDGGPADRSSLNFPTGSNPPPGGGLALDDRGRLFVADTLNHRIRVVDVASGVIDTFAGTGEAGAEGDGGPARHAQLNFPRKLTLGPDRRLYVGDQGNHRIRAIDLDDETIVTVAGNGEQGSSPDGTPALEASFNQPAGVSFDDQSAMYVIDTFNSRIVRIATRSEKGRHDL